MPDYGTWELYTGDAITQAVYSLMFVALHDEFHFGRVRTRQIVQYGDELPMGTGVATWEQSISRNGYNRGRMVRGFIQKLMTHLGADKYDPARYDYMKSIALGAVIIQLYVLCTRFNFTKDDVHRLEQRLYTYADILSQPKHYGVTIWRFMACIRAELNIRPTILTMWEKNNGKIDIGPKWGRNMLTGKPRKRGETII